VRNTLIEHKEAIVVCEKNGPINISYNVILTTPETNVGVKLVVHVMTVRSTLTCINCGKIGHSVETYHNRKREVLVVPTTTIKPTKLIVGIKTQLVKSIKIHVRYPYIIFFNVEHR
jgi:hypothetical protein